MIGCGCCLLANTVWPNAINLVALGADHLFFRWPEDAYVLAMLRTLDVAVRRFGLQSGVRLCSKRWQPATPNKSLQPADDVASC